MTSKFDDDLSSEDKGQSLAFDDVVDDDDIDLDDLIGLCCDD